MEKAASFSFALIIAFCYKMRIFRSLPMYEELYEEEMNEGEPAPFRLPGWIACAPFEEYLGMRIEEAAQGRAVLTMPFRLKMAQGMGYMHGGAITALADTAVAMAIKSRLPEGTDFVTVDLGLRFLAPVRGGTVRAEAKIVTHEGRSITGEAEMYDGKGVRVAVFTAHFRVKRKD